MIGGFKPQQHTSKNSGKSEGQVVTAWLSRQCEPNLWADSEIPETLKFKDQVENVVYDMQLYVRYAIVQI